MKVRNGFVSNSSSSSFTAVMTKEAYDAILAESHEYVKQIMNGLGYNDSKFCGKEVVSVGIMTGNIDTFEFFDFPDEEVWEAYVKSLGEDPGQTEIWELESNQSSANYAFDQFCEAVEEKDSDGFMGVGVDC